MLATTTMGLDLSKGLSDAIDLSFLNNGISFPGIENLSVRKIQIENRSGRGRVEVPVRFVSEASNARPIAKRSKNFRSIAYGMIVRVADNIVSFGLLIILKILQKAVNLSCSKLEKYRVEMDYSDRKEEVVTIKRLRPVS
jgi:hypothetical protein